MSVQIELMHRTLSYVSLILGGIIILKNAELFVRFDILGKKAKSNIPLLGGLLAFVGALLSDNLILKYTSFIWLFADVGCMPMLAFAIYSVVAERGKKPAAETVEQGEKNPGPDMVRVRHFAVQTITSLRIPLAAAAAVCMWLTWTNGVWPVVVAVGLLALLELTDFLDGLLARKWQVSGTFGELFDPYIDSASRLVVFFGLAAAGASTWWLLLVMAIRDVSVAYIRIMSLLTGRAVRSRLSGKLKAGVQGAGAIVLALTLLPADVLDRLGLVPFSEYIGPARLIVILLVAVVTAWSAVDYLFGAISKPQK